MRRVVAFFIAIFLIQGMMTAKRVSASMEPLKSESINSYEVTMRQDILSLMMAYPGYIVDMKRGNNGYVYLIMKSGRKIIYDDGRKKSVEEKLNNPDLQDMMEKAYPLGRVTKLMDINYDPGRAREYNLLSEVYGGNRQQIGGNLINVNIGGANCQFNRNNEAASSLRSAMKELVVLTRSNPRIGAFLFPCSGTFNYRVISGTGRLSPHSYGIAIDLARNNKDYWKWATPKQGQERLEVYPNEIVEVFEKHNFIWGGKWGHFDILHFEYRPEIIIKARYFGGKHDTGKAWYSGVYPQESPVKEYIYKIDQALR